MSFIRTYPKSLQVKLLCILFFGIVVTVAVFFWVQLENTKDRIQDDEKKNMQLLSSVLYSILEQTMAKGKIDEVSRALNVIAMSPSITEIEILDRDMNARFNSENKRSTDKTSLFTIPIRPRPVCRGCHGNPDPIGYLRIGFDTTTYEKRFYREVSITLGTSVAVLLTLTILVYICLQKGVFSRLQKINVAMQYFGRGNFRYRISVKGEDELSTMARVFNEMARNIYKINYRLYKVSEFPTIINRCLSEDDVYNKTIEFLMRFFEINGVAIILNEQEETVVASGGKTEGFLYIEPILIKEKEIGSIKISVSRDFTMEELSAIKIVTSSVSMALERIKQFSTS
ncbi:MAG: HAMP domain-containing protein [Nitrospirae bacterium]|nr:HAMP domain-containing protein [Nitrospirota bacterium]